MHLVCRYITVLGAGSRTVDRAWRLRDPSACASWVALAFVQLAASPEAQALNCSSLSNNVTSGNVTAADATRLAQNLTWAAKCSVPVLQPAQWWGCVQVEVG